MVTISITGGPSVQVNWQSGMNGQTAIEAAYNAGQNNFTYLLQYYGSELGYLVDMINGTFDTFFSTDEPYFFWNFIVNGTPSNTGIDNTAINDGDEITFTFTTFNAAAHAATTLGTKFKAKGGR